MWGRLTNGGGPGMRVWFAKALGVCKFPFIAGSGGRSSGRFVGPSGAGHSAGASPVEDFAYRLSRFGISRILRLRFQGRLRDGRRWELG